MFKFFEKKEKLEPLNVDDTSVVAMAEGELIDISTVPDDILEFRRVLFRSRLILEMTK
mgnify:CR=1 FL=1